VDVCLSLFVERGKETSVLRGRVVGCDGGIVTDVFARVCERFVTLFMKAKKSGGSPIALIVGYLKEIRLVMGVDVSDGNW